MVWYGITKAMSNLKKNGQQMNTSAIEESLQVDNFSISGPLD